MIQLQSSCVGIGKLSRTHMRQEDELKTAITDATSD